MARSFNGSTDVAKFASAVLANDNSCTLSCWFNAPDTTTTGGLISIDDGGRPNSFGLTCNRNTGGKVQGIFGFSSSETSTSFSINTWNHACAKFDSGPPAVTAYLNGGGKNVGGWSSQTAGTQTEIGTWGATNFFNGKIADAAVWNALLTDTEIAQLAKGISPRNIRPGSLIAYWPLFGLQSPEPDLSGNKQNLTLTGTALANHVPIVPFSRSFWGPNAPLIEISGLPASLMGWKTRYKRIPRVINY